MPFLHLKAAPLQSPERYAQLARALTDITVRLLGKRAEVTAMTIDDLPAARWAVGGQAPQQPVAMLEINITQGTNTPAQKAAFIHAAFEELQHQLAPAGTLEPASYVIVREVAASDWGYQGQTQLMRAQLREQARAWQAEVAAG